MYAYSSSTYQSTGSDLSFMDLSSASLCFGSKFWIQLGPIPFVSTGRNFCRESIESDLEDKYPQRNTHHLGQQFLSIIKKYWAVICRDTINIHV